MGTTVEAERVQHIRVNHDHDLVDVCGLLADMTTTSPPAPTTKVVEWAHGEHGLFMEDDGTPAGNLITTWRTGSVNAEEAIHTTSHTSWLTADRDWVQASDHVRRVVTGPGGDAPATISGNCAAKV